MDAALIGNFFDKNLFLKAQRAYFRHQNKNKFSNVIIFLFINYIPKTLVLTDFVYLNKVIREVSKSKLAEYHYSM